MTSPTKAEDSGSAAVLDPELTAADEVAKGEKQPEGRSPAS